MVRFFGLFSLGLAFIFQAWGISHGKIGPMLLFILGVFLCFLSENWDITPWKHS